MHNNQHKILCSLLFRNSLMYLLKRANIHTTKGNPQRKSEGDNQDDEHGKRQEPDLWGGNRDEQHHPQRRSETCRRVLRNRKVRGHRQPERLLHLERLDGGRQRVVMLLPARTDTKWFHDWVLPYGKIEFLRGRLKFGGCDNPAPFPSMIVIFEVKDF